MKKILVLLVIIITVIVSMANVDHENSNNQLSELTLSSIDALADGEKGCVNGPCIFRSIPVQHSGGAFST